MKKFSIKRVLIIASLLFTVGTFFASFFTEGLFQARTFNLFRNAAQVFSLLLFWAYLDRFYKRELRAKSIAADAVVVIAGLLVFLTLTLVLSLVGEYFIYVSKMENAAKNVVSFVLAEIPEVYANNIKLPLLLVQEELILLAVFVLAPVLRRVGNAEEKTADDSQETE